jgi:ubiquinone/menaquinone biosynthesis C-methylase UbiE
MNKINRLRHFKTHMMRVFFNQLYHKFAWIYDIVATSVSLGNWRDWIVSVAPYLPGPRVLELGHGPGHLLKSLCENGIQVYGIDESPTMGIIASNRLRKIPGHAGIIRGYAQNVPLPNLSFHQIVATFPSEYITDPRTLDEAFRVLLPGGKLIILPFAWITGKNVLERAAAWLFQVTDQSPKWSDQLLIPFYQAGFRPTLIPVTGNSWSTLIIIAEKPS